MQYFEAKFIVRFLHIVSCAIVEEVDYSDISFGDFSFLEEVI